MKKIITLFTITSFAMLAGCASDPASVNSNSGITKTQKQNENAEVVVANANDNANAEVNTNAVGTDLELSENTNNAEVDTSEWETYTNEESGFSVKYPRNWIYFNKIDSDGYAIYDNVTTDFVRFTNSENAYSASSFVDITITVTKSKPNSSTKKYITHNDQYYIFDEGTWSNEESLSVLEKMMQSIRFDS